MALFVIRFGEVPEPHGISEVTVRQSPFVAGTAAGVFRSIDREIVGSVFRRRERVRRVILARFPSLASCVLRPSRLGLAVQQGTTDEPGGDLWRPRSACR